MALERINPADWGVGDKLTSAQINAIDENVTHALDKRAGETDTLASDVTVIGTVTHEGDVTFDGNHTRFQNGGSLDIDVPTTISDDVDLEENAEIVAVAPGSGFVAGAAGAKIRTANGGRIELGDSDYPQLATGHTGRTVTRRVAAGRVQAQSSSTTDYGYADDIVQPDSGGHITRSISTTRFAIVDTASSTFSKAIYYDLTPYLIDGATITAVSVSVRGATGHAALPALMPRIRVGRNNGSTDSALHSSGTRVLDTSATTTAYQNTHAITATCDQNNVVDKSTCYYYLSVMNEGGTNAIAGMLVLDITLTQTITDLRPS